MNNDITLRDRAALAALVGLTVNKDNGIEEKAKLAYECADAFMAAREFDCKIDIYREKFKKDIEENKALKEYSEKRKTAFKPFYDYAKKHELSLSDIYNFTASYEYQEGDDVMALYKAWETECDNMQGQLSKEYGKLTAAALNRAIDDYKKVNNTS